MRLYKIYGNIKYIFNGNSQIVIEVKRETKDKIYGYVTLITGNLSSKQAEEYFGGSVFTKNKIVIIKKNIQGWVEIK